MNEREQRRFEAMAKTVYKDYAKGYEELIARIVQVQLKIVCKIARICYNQPER